MLDWQQLVRLSEEALSTHDIAEVNLACAQGLPGAERIDVPRCLRTLDQWADLVEQETGRIAHQFDRQPEAFNHSPAYFRAMVMVTVLQRDIGISYNPELIEREDFFADSRNLLLHGVIESKVGTCTSLPPLYVAVGRRLGYPLKLVECNSHLFARWDGEERLNIECTSRGFLSHPDEFYLAWPKETPPEGVRRFKYLQSQTPQGELAGFLCTRGHCWLDNKQYRQAVEAYALACEVDPEHGGYAQWLVDAMNQWDSHLKMLWVEGFPSMGITFPPRRYPSLPKDLEQGIFHLIVRENLLTHPELDRELWQPLRKNPEARPRGLPAHLTVEYPLDRNLPPRITPHAVVPASFNCQRR